MEQTKVRAKGKRSLKKEIYKNRMIYLLISPFFILYGISVGFAIIFREKQSSGLRILSFLFAGEVIY